jgi:hypothetical protein
MLYFQILGFHTDHSEFFCAKTRTDGTSVVYHISLGGFRPNIDAFLLNKKRYFVVFEREEHLERGNYYRIYDVPTLTAQNKRASYYFPNCTMNTLIMSHKPEDLSKILENNCRAVSLSLEGDPLRELYTASGRPSHHRKQPPSRKRHRPSGKRTTGDGSDDRRRPDTGDDVPSTHTTQPFTRKLKIQRLKARGAMERQEISMP